MIKKSDLRSVFERFVLSTKSVRFCVREFFRGHEHYVLKELPVTNFDIRIEEFNKSFKIMLYAKNGFRNEALLASSYPFRDYKSAYRVVVRL